MSFEQIVDGAIARGFGLSTVHLTGFMTTNAGGMINSNGDRLRCSLRDVGDSMETSEMVTLFTEQYDPRQLALSSGMKYVSIPVILLIETLGLAVCLGIAILVKAPFATAFVIYGFIAGPILLAAIASRCVELKSRSVRTLSFDSGELTWSDGTESEHCLLRQCCWHHGRGADDTSLRANPIRHPAVLIVMKSGRVVACGFDNESRSRWLDLIEAHGCRRVLPGSGWLGFAAGLVILAVGFGGGLAGGFLGWNIADWVQNLVIPNLANAWWSRLLPAFAATLLGWLGMRVVFLIPGVSRGTDEEPARMTLGTTKFALKIALPFGIYASGSPLAAIVFTAVFALVAFTVLYRDRKKHNSMK